MGFSQNIIATALLVAAQVPVSAAAQSDTANAAHFELELNTLLETDGSSCQVVLVGKNASADTIDRAVWNLAFFAADGKFKMLVAVEMRDMTPERSYLRRYNLPGMSCDGISRILINDASACSISGQDGKSPMCLNQLKPKSLVEGVSFGTS